MLVISKSNVRFGVVGRVLTCFEFKLVAFLINCREALQKIVVYNVPGRYLTTKVSLRAGLRARTAALWEQEIKLPFNF
jgi:hypothetical protein